MSDEKPFAIEKAKTGRASCKKCKQKLESGELRIAKLVANYFSDSGMMKHWHHIDCLFQAFKTQKATTKKIDSIEDVEGFGDLTAEEQDEILEKLFQATGKRLDKTPIVNKTSSDDVETQGNFKTDSNDNLLSTFINITEKIASESGYKAKSELLNKFLTKGSNKKVFEGDVGLWIKLLLPGTGKRVYNLQSKQLIKIFSRVFNTNQEEMLIDLEQGDVSETIKKYCDLSKKVDSEKSSSLTLQEVDKFLDELTTVTKEDEQTDAFSKLCEKANSDDLKIVIRLIKHDLKTTAGPRHILDALDLQAYAAFKNSNNLQAVVDKFSPLLRKNTTNISGGPSSATSPTKINGVQLMSPISPMLAEACKSVQKAIAKNADGMYSEIKYDGERVQIHKSGTDFKFFSRNLKPVMDHKINPCKKFIPQAFPTGQDMILDSEIIMVNRDTGELLPFGSLGVHKREQFAAAEVCLFIFDCIFYNGEDLTKRPLKERKKILEENIKPIKNHVQLSEYQLIKTEKELASMTAKVLKAGQEGLVLKNRNGLYQPGKRGWLKVKKDYLCEGQMADTADLVVLGGWFGTGKKGGMLSIFLMGCYDTRGKLWKTVTKVHSGLDDKEMEDLQDELKDLMERADADAPPRWLNCKKALISDFIAKDPNVMPVWEITGAEFSKSDAHTASGISIRFPRITRIRRDKSTKDATNLKELEKLFQTSKDNINVDMLFKGISKGDREADTDDSKSNDIMTKFLGGKVKRRSSDNDEGDSSPVKRIKKDPTESSSSDVKRIKKENIFKGLLMYIDSNAEDLESDFIEMGGKITKDQADAEIILHDTMYVEHDDVEKYRKRYSRNGRHVGLKWLQDSLESKQLMPYSFYAVEIC